MTAPGWRERRRSCSQTRNRGAALSRPARQVGGDYHAFFYRDGILSMLVADVAGKSMPAALLVSALHAAVQLLFAEGRELGDIATELNMHIHRWSAENKFITASLASIDRDAQTNREYRVEMFKFSGGDPTVPCIVENGKYVQSGWGDPLRG